MSNKGDEMIEITNSQRLIIIRYIKKDIRNGTTCNPITLKKLENLYDMEKIFSNKDKCCGKMFS